MVLSLLLSIIYEKFSKTIDFMGGFAPQGIKMGILKPKAYS